MDIIIGSQSGILEATTYMYTLTFLIGDGRMEPSSSRGMRQDDSTRSDESRDPGIDPLESDAASLPLETEAFRNLRYILLFVYLVIFTIGVAGNTLVIYVIMRNSAIRNKSVSNYYILNLAIADELYLLTLPFFCYATAASDWIFGDVICQLAFVFRECNKLGSVLTLMTLSVDRYLATHYNLAHLRMIKIGVMSCVMIWLISLVSCGAHVLHARAVPISGSNDGRHSCRLEWTPAFQRIWVYVQLVFGLIIPILVIATFNILLLRRLRQLERPCARAFSTCLAPPTAAHQPAVTVSDSRPPPIITTLQPSSTVANPQPHSSIATPKLDPTTTTHIMPTLSMSAPVPTIDPIQEGGCNVFNGTTNHELCSTASESSVGEKAKIERDEHELVGDPSILFVSSLKLSQRVNVEESSESCQRPGQRLSFVVLQQSTTRSNVPLSPPQVHHRRSLGNDGRCRKSTRTQTSIGMQRLIIAVVVMFVICHVPYHVVEIISLWMTERFEKNGIRPGRTFWTNFVYFNASAQILVFVSSCCNPVVYGIFNKNYRSLYCQVMCCLRREAGTAPSAGSKSDRGRRRQ